MTSRVVSMTLCRSRMPNSRAQREVAVCEVAPASDRLIHSVISATHHAKAANAKRAGTHVSLWEDLPMPVVAAARARGGRRSAPYPSAKGPGAGQIPGQFAR